MTRRTSRPALLYAGLFGGLVLFAPTAPGHANDAFERYEFMHRDAGTTAKRNVRANRGPVGLPFLSEIFGGRSDRIITSDPEFDQVDAIRQYPVKSIYDDPTLRPGDMVVTERGVEVYQGRRGSKVRPEDFGPIDLARMPRAERAFLAAIDRQQVLARSSNQIEIVETPDVSTVETAGIRLSDRLPAPETRPANVRIVGDALPVVTAE